NNATETVSKKHQHELYEQVLRYEVEVLVNKYEIRDFIGAILDEENTERGIVGQNIRSHEIKSFPADAVILASGGPGIIFGKPTNSMINTGSAASILYRQGAKYANGEFIQIHPPATPRD